MRLLETLRLAALSLALLGLTAGSASASPDLPDWVQAAETLTLGDEAPGLTRPVIGAWTNYYAYGVAPFGSAVEFYSTIQANGYDSAVTMYVIWENRATGQSSFFNLDQGLVTSEVDLFSQGGSPVAILAPSLDAVQLFGPAGALGTYPGSTATGQYQLIVELRDASGNAVIARDNAMFNFVDAAIPVSGTAASASWSANNAYILTGPTRFTGTLNIAPGTFVLCQPDSDSVLSILQGATINANGTNKLPIVISSSLEWSSRQRGDCGGLTVNGFGTINVGTSEGEGDSGTYGGNNPQDNSGTLRYVRVEFAGVLYTDQNELNGIALQGVGAGTTVDNIMVSYGQDDGLEFFGGNADVSFYVGYNNRDDTLDATEGWSGLASNVCLIQTTESTDKPVEFDSNSSVFDLEPRTLGRITGFTIVATGNDDAMVFRVGSYYDLNDGVILNANGRKAIKLGDDDKPGDPTPTFPGTQFGKINNVFFQNGVVGDDAAIQSGNLRLANPGNTVKPDFRVRTGNLGNQGCVTRADPWAFDEWTEYQPGPIL